MDTWIFTLPFDLYMNEIVPYFVSSCSKCNKKKYFFDYSTNVRMKKYKSIFEDDFYLYRSDEHESIYFNILCNKCYVSFLHMGYFRVNTCIMILD